MRSLLAFPLVLALLVSLAAAPSSAADDVAPPPGAEGALAALEKSPRHGEWVDIPLAPQGPTMRAFVVYPERKDKAPVVIVIQEVYGLSPWLRSVADRLAADGFIAVAPDYLWGYGKGGAGTDSIGTRDDIVKATRALTPEEVVRRTNAARAYGLALPSANGRVATMGFCWGGARSFEYAAQTPPPDAAVVFYGSSPDSATLTKVAAPVIGFYGEDDERVNSTIPPAKAALSARGRFYEVNIHPGAGHGFLRQQEAREGANLAAAKEAWPVAVSFLRKRLERPADTK